VKLVYWLIGLFVYLMIPLASVQAVGEFTADYDVQYAVAPSGVAIVTQNITLTNQLSNLYPQQYSIIIDSTNIRNVIAYDNLGIIRPTITQTDGKTNIALTFNEKIAGLGKQLRFSLRYESTDIAIRNGNIWEVNIPGVAKDPDLSSYLVSLRVPPSFGSNAYMSPLPAQSGRWTKEQMVSGGISAAYGTSQAFDLTLSYFLENPSVTKKRTELALPPDTAFQKIIVRSLEPAPTTVIKDADGNWMAQYDLLPTQRLEVKAQIIALTSLSPREGYKEQPVDMRMYTRADKYWETGDARIIELAKQYTTPRQIYDYVVRTLSYDYKRVTEVPIRKGASQAMDNPQNSICMEFTDLFIAIARAAGIPAREAVGYAHTTNARLRPLSFVSDVLHAWPEYYDGERGIWIPVDPTWADTTGGINYFDKLDFNHIVFSYHGQESDYPYPVGYYKKPGDHSKDITVTFAERIPNVSQSKITISYNFPDQVSAGLEASGEVMIHNHGETAYDDPLLVTIQSTPTDVAVTKTITGIPPYGAISIPVSFTIPHYLYRGAGALVTSAGDQVQRHDFEIVPLMYRFLLPIGIGSAIVVILLVFWIRSGLWKRHKKQ
jgi:transglutaminase-like putative cysteine protease